jgi:hypothetical protein
MTSVEIAGLYGGCVSRIVQPGLLTGSSRAFLENCTRSIARIDVAG